MQHKSASSKENAQPEASESIGEEELREAPPAGGAGDIKGDASADQPEDGREAGVSDETAEDAAVAEAEARFKELSDRYVRLVADFDNFRRRTRANEATVREQAATNLIQDLLPVIDNLQLALSKTEDSEDGFASGVILIEQQLMTVLQNHGVEPINTMGEPFDPNYMEAVAQIDAPDGVEPGHVAEELRRGYLLHNKVLRPAQVIVARTD